MKKFVVLLKLSKKEEIILVLFLAMDTRKILMININL